MSTILSDILYRIERLSPKIPKHTAEEEEERVRGIVMLYGDHPYLSQGRYLTEKDIERMRADIIHRRSYSRK